jgi:hypothetical protein
MTREHETIWLQPWCGECELRAWDIETGRQWCQDNPWEDCECGAKPVKYVLAEKDKA